MQIPIITTSRGRGQPLALGTSTWRGPGRDVVFLPQGHREIQQILEAWQLVLDHWCPHCFRNVYLSKAFLLPS